MRSIAKIYVEDTLLPQLAITYILQMSNRNVMLKFVKLKLIKVIGIDYVRGIIAWTRSPKSKDNKSSS